MLDLDPSNEKVGSECPWVGSECPWAGCLNLKRGIPMQDFWRFRIIHSSSKLPNWTSFRSLHPWCCMWNKTFYPTCPPAVLLPRSGAFKNRPRSSQAHTRKWAPNKVQAIALLGSTGGISRILPRIFTIICCTISPLPPLTLTPSPHVTSGSV